MGDKLHELQHKHLDLSSVPKIREILMPCVQKLDTTRYLSLSTNRTHNEGK